MAQRFFYLQLLGIFIVTRALIWERQLDLVYSWKALDYAFPNDSARETAIKNGDFNFGNVIAIDVDVYYGGDKPIVFVTSPRFQHGIPATLGYVTDNVTPDGNPVIAPYPSWEWNSLGSCDSMVSVFRVQIDPCGRLWVLDTGMLGDERLCSPQLLVFDLKTDELLTRYRFPEEVYKDNSLFVTPIVDIRDEAKCSDAFVYIADVQAFALVVYDHTKSMSWRITNQLFYPYPESGTFYIDHESFDLMDGILGLALSPVNSHGDRTLYFHSLASKVESWVLTSVIRNYTTFAKDSAAVPRSFHAFGLERSSQSAAEAMDSKGNLFFGLMTDLALGCWNDEYEYSRRNIRKVVVNRDTMQFASGLKILTGPSGREELWVLTNSFQKFMTGTASSNETNIRIQTAYIDHLVRDGKCRPWGLNWPFWRGLDERV